MLKDFLANTTVYTCINHTESLVDEYINELDAIFSKIKECEEGKNINDLLDGDICHTGFPG